MPKKSRELGTASLAGLVVGGLMATVLEIVQVSFAPVIGALIGGMVAAYVLYGKVGQAALAGSVSGFLSTLVYLGASQIMYIFGLFPVPTGPTPEMSELQAAVVIIVGMNLVAGAVGGVILGALHHPPGDLPPPPPPPSIAGGQAGQVRYCAQCGAQLPSGALICPHCSARQP
jgi:hypothetical protein